MQRVAMFHSLREYKPSDRDAVMQLNALALAGLSVPGLPRNFDDLKDIESRYLRNGSFVVAEIDDDLIGIGGIRYVDQQTARINRMRVHPLHQRKGIARALLHWLEHKAREAGKATILLNTLAVQEHAQRLYESSGYVKIGEGAPDGFNVFMYEKKI